MVLEERMKNRRKELDLTLADIAKAVGVSEATVQRWESGKIKNLRYERIPRPCGRLAYHASLSDGLGRKPGRNSLQQGYAEGGC